MVLVSFLVLECFHRFYILHAFAFVGMFALPLDFSNKRTVSNDFGSRCHIFLVWPTIPDGSFADCRRCCCPDAQGYILPSNG